MSKKIIKITTNKSYNLIGLKTSKKDYKIAWLLNSELLCNFTTVNLNISLYGTVTPTKVLFWENTNNFQYYLKDLKQFNFLFKIFDNQNNKEFAKEILKVLKSEIISIIDEEKLTKKSQAFIKKLDF